MPDWMVGSVGRFWVMVDLKKSKGFSVLLYTKISRKTWEVETDLV